MPLAGCRRASKADSNSMAVFATEVAACMLLIAAYDRPFIARYRFLAGTGLRLADFPACIQTTRGLAEVSPLPSWVALGPHLDVGSESRPRAAASSQLPCHGAGVRVATPGNRLCEPARGGEGQRYRIGDCARGLRPASLRANSNLSRVRGARRWLAPVRLIFSRWI